MTIFQGLFGPESGTPARAKFWALPALERYPFGPPRTRPETCPTATLRVGPDPLKLPHIWPALALFTPKMTHKRTESAWNGVKIDFFAPQPPFTYPWVPFRARTTVIAGGWEKSCSKKNMADIPSHETSYRDLLCAPELAKSEGLHT